MAFAVLTGWPTLRLRSEYLALTTFAFAEMLHSLLVNERRIGNGTSALPMWSVPIPAAWAFRMPGPMQALPSC